MSTRTYFSQEIHINKRCLGADLQFFVMFNCQLFHVWMELPLKIFRNVNQQGGKNPFLRGKLALNVTFIESHRIDDS